MLLTAIGGLALFLLGIHKIAGALQEMLGPSARRLMSAATRSPFHALLTGTGVAAATQSGTATAMTALGLVGGGLIGVSAGIALLLGAKLGATLAIQLAAFSLGAYAWAMIGVGYFSSLWQRFKQPGTLLLGAGLLFLGLDVTVDSMTALAGGELFSMLIEAANNRPLAMLVIGAALGAILSSGNAVTALGLGLYLSDGVSLSTAIALVAGGNAGSSLMPLLVSRTFDASAQRAALMQMLVRAVGALAVGLFVEPITDLVAAIGGGAAREIANAHTFFNLAVALVGTVLASPLARLSGELVPKGEDDAAPKYLRKDAISNRKLAPALALRETIRISDQVAVMTELAVENLESGRWNTGPIEAREAKVDRLTHEVVDYLARMRRLRDDDRMSEYLLLVATELEHIGDQIRRLGKREQRLRKEGLEFSRAGRAELTKTGADVLERMRMAFTALATGNERMANRVLEGREELEGLVARMRVAHLSRLEAQLPESRASSSHHLEVLTLLRDIDASVCRIAGRTVDIKEISAAEQLPVSEVAAPDGAA